MSSFVQHFSDGSVWGCIDDYFRHHEYGYIKLKDVSEWYNLSTDKNWKNRVLSENTFHDAVKGLERIRPEPKAPEKKKEKTNPSEVEEKPQFYVWDIDITTGKPFKSGSTAQVYSTVEPPSIFEKLREELYKMKSENVDRSEYTQWVLNACDYLLDLLTSLEQSYNWTQWGNSFSFYWETKEEPTEKDPWEEASALCTHIVKTSDPLHCLKCWEVLSEKAETQFTPWQEESLIKNTIYNNCSGCTTEEERKEWATIYDCSGETKDLPIEDKIEPELPAFDYEKLEENIRDVEFEKIDELRHMIGHIGKQIEALTTFCQSLARQKPNK